MDFDRNCKSTFSSERSKRFEWITTIHMGYMLTNIVGKPPPTNEVGATINIHGVGPSATSFDWATTFGGKSDWQPRQHNWISSSTSGSSIAIKSGLATMA